MRKWSRGSLTKRGGIYWMSVYVDGVRIRETTGARTEHEAKTVLTRRIKELTNETGKPVVTVDILLDDLQTDYAL